MARKKPRPIWFKRISLICISALAGIIGPILFVLIVFIIDYFQPEHNPIYETVSELVHGSYGWIQTLSFILFGVLLMIFTLRLYLASSPKLTSVLGASFISLSGFSFLLLGAFPSQISDVALNPVPVLHNVGAGVAGGTFIIGCALFALYFRGDVKWERYWAYTAITAIACLFFALLWALTPLGLRAKGLDQLLMLGSGFIWIEIISIQLIRSCLKEG